MKSQIKESVNIMLKTNGGLFLLFVVAVIIFLALLWPQPSAREGESAWLGIMGRALDPQTAQDSRLPFTQGIVIDTVYPGSPAYYSNLAPGDIIVKYNNKAVLDLAQLRRYVAQADPQEQVMLTVFRNGAYYNVLLALGKKPADKSVQAQAAAVTQNTALTAPPPIPSDAIMAHTYRGVCTNCHIITDKTTGPPAAPALPPPITSNAVMGHAYRGVCSNCHVITDKTLIGPAAQPAALQPAAQQPLPMRYLPGGTALAAATEFNWAGIAMENLTPNGAVAMGLPASTTGVQVDEVLAGSRAERGGIRAGDLIREINGFAIYDVQSFVDIVQDRQMTGGVLLIYRAGKPTYVTVPEM